MKIIKFNWISKEALEAELLITDGEFECLVFSQPCKFHLGDILPEPLHAFMVTDLMMSQANEASLSKIKDSYFSYKIIAKVTDLNNSIVAVGKILITLELPGWAQDDQYVEFECQRLDLW